MTNTLIFTAAQLDRFLNVNPETTKRVKVVSHDKIGFDALIDGAAERFDYPFSSGAFEEILGNIDNYEFETIKGKIREVAVVVNQVRLYVKFTPEFEVTEIGYNNEPIHGDGIIGVEIDEISLQNGEEVVIKDGDIAHFKAIENAVLTRLEELKEG